MCQILYVSRNGYYAWATRPKSHRKQLNCEFLERIKEIQKVSRETYGSPRVTKALNNGGIKCGKNRVATSVIKCHTGDNFFTLNIPLILHPQVPYYIISIHLY